MDIELVEPTEEERRGILGDMSSEEWKDEQIAILSAALLEARYAFKFAEGGFVALNNKGMSAHMHVVLRKTDAALRRADIPHVTMTDDAKG